MSVMDVVGMSPWGIINDQLGLCQVCDGTGELAITLQAAINPQAFPDETVDCCECNGTGKQPSER